MLKEMLMKKRKHILLIAAGLTLCVIAMLITQFPATAWTSKAVKDDPLVRMPGTQPGDVTLDYSGCSCHEFTSAENTAPVDGWRGSMMAQSSRDFLFLATMTVAAQDAIWAVGTPNATDICIRCHFPVGWVNGHSDPTNASLMDKGDFDGVQCTLCHYIFDPFFEDTYAGAREGNDWLNYWDETNLSSTPSQDAADAAHLVDQGFSANFSMFNTSSFFDVITHKPPSTYLENASGQFFVGSATNRRGSYADTTAPSNHQWVYSRYHKSKYFCATCHDISNPVLANFGQTGTAPLTSETDPAYTYYHVERTFSEFMLSAYGAQGGAEGLGPFAKDVFITSQPDNKIASCQDCHMHDVYNAEVASGGVIRPTDSTEHPNSGISVHDLTGGSVWVPTILASTVTGESYSDATNRSLLNGHLDDLTLDLSTNQSLGFDDPNALVAGADRSLQMLQMAAVITDVFYSPFDGNLRFVVQNQTGHKLISGYPEGRRMFVNIKYYDENGTLIHEVNPYDGNAGTLIGLTGYTYADPDNVLPGPATLSENEDYVDELVYEMHGSTTFNTTEGDATFHFVLSDGRYKDNRIPPKGFDIANAAARISEPVWEGASDLNYFTAEEYAGGYDQVSMDDFGILVTDAVTVEVSLNYQSTSREYIEFLRDEINGTGNLTLSGLGVGGDPAYLIQTNAFCEPGVIPSGTFGFITWMLLVLPRLRLLLGNGVPHL
jgi:hypothetical protein